MLLRRVLTLAARYQRNFNGPLRRYFPKDTSLRHHTRERFDVVAAQLNARPRQTLGGRHLPLNSPRSWNPATGLALSPAMCDDPLNPPITDRRIRRRCPSPSFRGRAESCWPSVSEAA